MKHVECYRWNICFGVVGGDVQRQGGAGVCERRRAVGKCAVGVTVFKVEVGLNQDQPFPLHGDGQADR